MAKRIFDLPETKGFFQLKGIVSGTKKDGFYKELKTKSNKNMRFTNFGVSYEKEKTLYLNNQGMEQEYVYFSKKAEKKGEKGDTQKVPWVDRFSFNRDGYRLIGNIIGVKKKVDEEGKTVNDSKVLTDFDTCKEISDNLKDGNSVFTKGNIDYSSYIDKNGDKRMSTKLVPTQVSLCADIDYDSDDYNVQSNFNQVIIFMGIEKEKENDKDTGRFVVSAKIVTWSNIEDVEFIIENNNLASMFKRNLKPYNSIKVSGKMISSVAKETVDDDEWGEGDVMERVVAPAKKEFIITGAKGSTVDRETYTEENVEDAINKINKSNKADSDYGDDSSEWGDLDSSDEDDFDW